VRVEKVVIEGFGKFEDFTVEFKEGINIVFGKNSTGKTTLANFIKYCLTGHLENLEDFRPWHSRKFGGKLTLDGKELLFGEGRIDPDEYFFTSFLPESEDSSYNGSEKIMKILKEHRYNTETASFFRKILESSFEGLRRMEREIDLSIKELEKKLEAWYERRDELKKLLVERNRLLEELDNKKNRFSSEMQKFMREKEKRLAEIDAEIGKLESEREATRRELERMPHRLISLETCKEIEDKVEKLAFSKGRKEELIGEIEVLNEKLAETREKIKELISQVGAEDLEGFMLRIENLKLQAEVLKEKKKHELREILERLKKPLESVENELNEVNEEMVKAGEVLAKRDKKLSLFKVLLLSSAAFSLVSTLFSLFSSRYLLILTALGLSLTGVFAWRYFYTKRECAKLERTLSELTAKRKDLMEKRSAMIMEIKGTTGVEDLNSLEERLKRDLNSEFLRRHPYLSAFGKDPESAIDALERRLNELLMSKETIEAALLEKNRAVEELESFMNRVEKEVKSALTEMGFVSVEDMKEAVEVYRRREALEEKLRDIEKRLQALMKEREEIEQRVSSVELDSLKWDIEFLERKVEEMRLDRLEEPWDVLEELYRKKVEYALVSEKIGHIPLLKDKAKKLLEEFLEGYTKEIEIGLIEGYKHFFGAVVNFKVHPDLKVRIRGYEDRELSRTMSKSCLTLIAFLLKKNVSELLEVNYPFIIDNSFVDLDDERVEKVWEYLVEVARKRQVIFFTSDKRFLKKDPIVVLS